MSGLLLSHEQKWTDILSRHFFSAHYAGTPVTVILGWDRPLGHFFMVIESAVESASGLLGGEDEEDGLLYSNLNESEPFGLGLDHFRGVLARLGIQVPEEMFVQVWQDHATNIGNRDVRYQPDGSFQDVGKRF